MYFVLRSFPSTFYPEPDVITEFYRHDNLATNSDHYSGCPRQKEYAFEATKETIEFSIVVPAPSPNKGSTGII